MKKQKPHYVDNKKFTAAVFEYVKECDKARSEEKPLPEVTDYIAECIMKIAEKLSHSSNFIGYSYRDEMVMDAVENCIKVICNYDIEKSTRTGSPNAFGYFTQIAYYAFIRRIQKENKQVDIKMRYMENITSDDIAYSEGNESVIDSSFIEKLRERVDVVRKNETGSSKRNETPIKKPLHKKDKVIGLEQFLID